jgi:hypothetical protein
MIGHGQVIVAPGSPQAQSRLIFERKGKRGQPSKFVH